MDKSACCLRMRYELEYSHTCKKLDVSTHVPIIPALGVGGRQEGPETLLASQAKAASSRFSES